MGRIKRGGYLIEWWIGDHDPKHVHVYEKGYEIAKIQMPGMIVLSGRMGRRLRKLLEELVQKGLL